MIEELASVEFVSSKIKDAIAEQLAKNIDAELLALAETNEKVGAHKTAQGE